ncbi:MAG: acyl-CoA dehydrogenase [Actinobacteria bacterium]|nr:MAG: acyl-CoA dehydrogenase [Actinomycetota bacterium]
MTVTTQAPAGRTLDDRLAEVLPVLHDESREVDDTAEFPVRGLAALRESGLMGLLVPEELGGLGGDLDDLVSVSMELAGECLSTALIWGMHCQQVAALVGHAGPELRERVLPRIGEGKVYVASVTSEKGKGGHLLSAEAPLRREDGTLLLERDAPIVTGALQADGFLVTMRDDESAPPNAVTLVYADRDDLTIEASGSWNPMGMRGTHSVAVKLAGRLPESNVVGRPGEFRTVATRSFIPAGHIAWAACWLGSARAATKAVVELLRSPSGRKQFDVDSETLRTRLARVRVDLDAIAALLSQVVRDATSEDDPEPPPIQLRLNALKIFSSERSFAVVDELIQLVGLRYGYIRDAPFPLERLFRDLRSASLNYANDRLLLANGALALLDREVTLAPAAGR